MGSWPCGRPSLLQIAHHLALTTPGLLQQQLLLPSLHAANHTSHIRICHTGATANLLEAGLDPLLQRQFKVKPGTVTAYDNIPPTTPATSLLTSASPLPGWPSDAAFILLYAAAKQAHTN
jgi:hypothetical protein